MPDYLTPVNLVVKNLGSLLRTVWFFNTVHFGMRGVTEHHDMCWGDVKLLTDSNRCEFLQYTERLIKTRNGVNARDIRPIIPSEWANNENESRCPVYV